MSYRESERARSATPRRQALHERLFGSGGRRISCPTTPICVRNWRSARCGTDGAWRQRALLAVASFAALKLEGQVQKFGRSAPNAGLSKSEIIETVVQTGLHSGLAPALNALARLSPSAAIKRRHSSQGLTMATPQPSKSRTLRVMMLASCARAMAAIIRSVGFVGRPARRRAAKISA